jgi:hypothetical protein
MPRSRLKVMRHTRFWIYILLILFIPGSTAAIIALNITKSTPPFQEILGRRLRRYLRIIYTSKTNIFLVCVLENILHCVILGSLSFIIIF